MKKLFIPLIDEMDTNPVSTLESLLFSYPANIVNFQPWSVKSKNCQTSFKIAHNGKAIFLKFEVTEDTIRVNTYETNGPVNKDNCVEFFVSFGSENKYYNIEVNCAGILRVAYGKGRSNRIFVTEEAINKIKTHVEIKTAPINSITKYQWTINLIIPIEVFEHSKVTTLKTQPAFGNFFKCGDDLPVKHFYAWSDIIAKKPDFHLPEFFGALIFE